MSQAKAPWTASTFFFMHNHINVHSCSCALNRQKCKCPFLLPCFDIEKWFLLPNLMDHTIQCNCGVVAMVHVMSHSTLNWFYMLFHASHVNVHTCFHALNIQKCKCPFLLPCIDIEKQFLLTKVPWCQSILSLHLELPIHEQDEYSKGSVSDFHTYNLASVRYFALTTPMT